MAIDFGSAVSAYKSAATMGADAGAAAGGATQPGGGFADMVRDAVESTIEAQHQSEEVSKQAIAGTADMRELVMAINNAEVTLTTVTAVRDKVVSSYETILRMPV